jgi:hypothetical protein
VAYADNENLLGDNIDTIKKSTEVSIYASKEVGLEINVKKTKYSRLPSIRPNVAEGQAG